MIINFNEVPTQTISGMHGGEGDVVAKIHESAFGKVTPCRLQPGASIGLHRHDDSMEVCYVLYGAGVAYCDGVEEALAVDVCHICPKGSEHRIVNTGGVELVMLQTVFANSVCIQ